LKPHLQTTIWTLLEANASQREIERITGISRHTIRAYQQRFAAERADCPGVATGSDAVASQNAPPRPPAPVAEPIPVTTSLCEHHREFIEAQLRLKRNAMAIFQDLVDQHGFGGRYNSVKRFCAKLRHKEPEQFDRLSFLPGEEMQVDYGEGAYTLVPGSDRYRKPRLFVATLRYSRLSFRCVVWKSSHQVWAEFHERAFRHFGGCPQYVVLDFVPGNKIQLLWRSPLCVDAPGEPRRHWGCAGWWSRSASAPCVGSILNRRSISSRSK